MNKLLHNNTLFTLTLLGIATALAFLFFSFVSENTANIALLYIIAKSRFSLQLSLSFSIPSSEITLFTTVLVFIL